MHGMTERSFSRGSLIRSGIWMPPVLSNKLIDSFHLMDVGSAVPAAYIPAKAEPSGAKDFEIRRAPWLYDWTRWGENKLDRTAQFDAGGNLARCYNMDGRNLWGSDSVFRMHDHSGSPGYARATVLGTAASADRLQVQDGTNTRLFEGEATVGIFDFLGTQAVGDQIRVADGVNTLTLTLGTDTDLQFGRVTMGATAAETAINVYQALVAAVEQGYLAADIRVYQDAAANITLTRFSTAGTLTLTAPTNAGPTINAGTLQSLAPTAGDVRFAIRSTAAQTAEDLTAAINYDIGQGNLDSDISVYQEQTALGAHEPTIRFRRPAGVVTLTATMNAGPTTGGIVSMTAARPLKMKIRMEGFSCLNVPLHETVTLEADGDGTAPADVYYRSRFVYSIMRIRILELENHTSEDWIKAGHEWRHDSLRVSFLASPGDTDTYTINDGVNAPVVLEFDTSVGSAEVQATQALADQLSVDDGVNPAVVFTLVAGPAPVPPEVQIGGTPAATAANIAAEINNQVTLGNLRADLYAHTAGDTILVSGYLDGTITILAPTNVGPTFASLTNQAALAAGAARVEVEGSVAADLQNLQDTLQYLVDATTLNATIVMTQHTNAVNTLELCIWDTAAANRAGYRHAQTGGDIYLGDGPGKAGFSMLTGSPQPMSENNIKIALFWRIRDIRDITCVKFDRQHVGNGLAGLLEFNNNSRGFYPLDLVRGNGTRAPYIDRKDGSLVVNGYAEMTRSAVYAPSGAVHELKDYPEVGNHFLLFQYDPIEPWDIPEHASLVEEITPGLSSEA